MDERQFLSAVRYRCDDMGEEELLRSWLGVKEELPQWVVAEVSPRFAYISALSEPLSRFIMPRIKIRKGLQVKNYLAPSDMLAGMSLQQFMSVDNFFQFYTSTQREEFLLKFVACLYLRPHRAFSGKHLVDIEGEAEALRALPQFTLLAIYVNWILVKNWLSRTFRYLFSSGGGSTRAEGSPKGTDWLEIFDAFVGDHVADMEAYQKMNCMDAFRIMNGKIKSNKQRERS